MKITGKKWKEPGKTITIYKNKENWEKLEQQKSKKGKNKQ